MLRDGYHSDRHAWCWSSYTCSSIHLEKEPLNQWLDWMWQTEDLPWDCWRQISSPFFYEVLDCMILVYAKQTEQRFLQEIQILLISFSYLQPEELLNWGKEQEAEIKLVKLSQFYASAWVFSFQGVQKRKMVLDVLQTLHHTDLHRLYVMYSELYWLYRSQSL